MRVHTNHNVEYDYVVEYNERNDSAFVARFLFGLGVTWAIVVAIVISQSVN